MKRIKIIIACCIGIFLCMLDTTVMNIALPAIQSGLQVPLNQLSYPLNVYTIIFASLTIPLGKLAERSGLNKFYCGGLCLFLLGSIVSGCSNTLLSLVTGRALQSIGAAIVFPLSMTIGINTSSMQARSQVIAALGVTQGLAAALGPVIGGIVTQFFGWKWIFFINVPLTLVALVLCVTSFNFHEQRLAHSIDVLGAVLSIVTLASFTLALVQGRGWGWHSIKIECLFLISVIALILFFVCEKVSNHPMIPLDLFKNKEFNGAALAIVLSNLFLVAVTVVLPTYFTKVQSKTELMASLLITPISAMIFISSPFAGFIVDKISPRIIIGSGFTLMTGAYIMFSIINMKNYYFIVFACILLGLGYGIIAGPSTVLAASNFTGRLLNASQSVAGVLREVGIVLAVAVYVTGLYNNIAVAKTNSTCYAAKEVAQLKIPKNKKKIIDRKVNAAVSHENLSSKVTSNHFSKKDINQLVDAEYLRILNREPQLSQVGKQRVRSKVTTAVMTKVRRLNAQINGKIKVIKKYVRRQFDNAFSKLYAYSIPFVGMAILSFLMFDKKRLCAESK